MSVKFMRKMILAVVNNKIIKTIETGHFDVGTLVDKLSEMNPTDAFMRDCMNRIIDAVRKQGYTVSHGNGRYFIYR